MTTPTFATVDELVAHLAHLATLPSVEGDFSELDHGLQTAALLHASDPDDPELVVAGLVHDLAHPWDGEGQPRHAGLAAAAVRPILGRRVAHLVGAHVAAKRYLVAVDPAYQERLSPDSVATLRAQGRAMSPAEREAFARRGDLEAVLALRRADDAAKVPGAVVPGLDRWIPMVAAVGAGAAAPGGGGQPDGSPASSGTSSSTRSHRSRQSSQR